MQNYYSYEHLLARPNLTGELGIELAGRRLRQFVQQAWPVVEPATRFVPGWHIDAICEHLEAVSRVHAVTPQIEAGNVYLPEARLASWIGAFMDECAAFP